MSDLAADLARTLATRGSRARAIGNAAYLKSDLAFFGVTTPVLRATVKAVLRAHEPTRAQLVAAVAALWPARVFDLRAAAVELLMLRPKLLEARDAALIEKLLRDSHTWALVDSLAVHVMGRLVEANRSLSRTLDRWARDDDFWLRRAAMLSLLVPLRRGGGDFARFTRYADRMLEEREFFIRKAIGWVLRDTAHKTPDRVFAWLEPRAHRAAGLTVREATKYFTRGQVAAITRSRVHAAREVR